MVTLESSELQLTNCADGTLPQLTELDVMEAQIKSMSAACAAFYLTTPSLTLQQKQLK
jgi:hypothetical protein